MRAIILAGFFLCIVLTLTDAELGKPCDRAEDCDEDECCTRIMNRMPSICKNIRKKGERCLGGVVKERSAILRKFTGVYTYGCPCETGSQCKPMKEQDYDGRHTFTKESCQ